MDLQKERGNLVAQRDNALAVYHQAVGAIMLLDTLLADNASRGSRDALTVEDIGKIVGASEISEPEPIANNNPEV